MLTVRVLFAAVLAVPALVVLVLLVLLLAGATAGTALWVTVIGLLGTAVAVLGLAWALTSALVRLRDATGQVLGRDLPLTVRWLSRPGALAGRSVDEVVAATGDAIAVYTQDEIGQVAAAVNALHREAVRGAAGQAQVHADAVVMVDAAVGRATALIDAMVAEVVLDRSGETEPGRLDRLSGLDRLAARLRRHEENLRVLVGSDAAPVPARDQPLRAVVRDARTEIELSAQVDFDTVDRDVTVAGHATADLVRILAELLDNATRYAPPSSTVQVDGRIIGDHALIEVEDRGPGLPPDRLAGINALLLAPPDPGVTTGTELGLIVVARLAARQQVRVQLHAGSGGGTVARVTLSPAALVAPARGAEPSLPRPRTALESSPLSWPPPTGTATVPVAGQQSFRPAMAEPVPHEEPAIFREMQAVWFTDHDQPSENFPSGSGPDATFDGSWSTAADEGWRAAAAAAEPTVDETTDAGLPRRTPAANLVPGTVEAAVDATPTRRTATEVRGVLVAYHRGVQRGRVGGDAQSVDTTPAVDDESPA